MTTEFTLGINTSVQQDNDGKHWGVLHIATPLVSYAIQLTPDSCEDLALQLPVMLLELADSVKRANNPLTVAHPNALHAIREKRN